MKSAAHIVGSPWFNLSAGQQIEEFAAKAPRAWSGPTLEQPGIVPHGKWVECLWMPANALFRKSVFNAVTYDGGIGNYYRDETDLYVAAARAGFRGLATSCAYTYIKGRAQGGIARPSRLKYELLVVRNNWRVLLKARWLAAGTTTHPRSCA